MKNRSVRRRSMWYRNLDPGDTRKVFQHTAVLPFTETRQSGAIIVTPRRTATTVRPVYRNKSGMLLEFTSLQSVIARQAKAKLDAEEGPLILGAVPQYMAPTKADADILIDQMWEQHQTKLDQLMAGRSVSHVTVGQKPASTPVPDLVPPA